MSMYPHKRVRQRFVMLLIAVFMIALVFLPVGLTIAQGPQPQNAATLAGTGFTYQGQLKNGGVTVNSNCDIAFRLFDAETSGVQVGAPLTRTVPVTNGLFTTLLDFGAGALNGEARWLDLRVHCPSGPGAFVLLSPRQALTAAPLALALPGLWTRTGASSPNIIGGFVGNTVDSGLSGATIGGGGSLGAINSIQGDFATIAGGSANTAAGPASAIGGGSGNLSLEDHTTIGGGQANRADSAYATIGGGHDNLSAADSTSVGGGAHNQATNDNATVGGGFFNRANGYASTIPGGSSNVTEGEYSFAAGLRARAIHDGTFVWADDSGTPFTSTLTQQFLIRATNGVGIGTNAPATQLHVVKASSGFASNLGDHVAAIENNGVVPGNGPDVLALKVTNAITPDSSMNYITFFAKNGAIAAIEGNGSGGVTYKTVGADFAEYLPLRSAGEKLNAGDIVGVSDGHVSKQTRGANQLFVVSSSAGFVGNMPRADSPDAALVALLGQATVNVRGTVHAGDFIVPSGQNDGGGVAVGMEQLSAGQAQQIVGRALADANDDSVKPVNVMVGIPHDAVYTELLRQKETRLAALETRVAALEQSRNGVDPDHADWAKLTVGLGAAVLVVGRLRQRARKGRRWVSIL